MHSRVQVKGDLVAYVSGLAVRRAVTDEARALISAILDARGRRPRASDTILAPSAEPFRHAYTETPSHRRRARRRVQVGGGAPVVVQSMTSTDTTDVAATVRRRRARGGRLRAGPHHRQHAGGRRRVPEIRRACSTWAATCRSSATSTTTATCCSRATPACAEALDKYRINPGNVGTGTRRDEQFATICKVARDHGRPVRIGVNGGSLNQDLVVRKMQENTDHDLGESRRRSSTSAW
jgi:hypothetical protein